MPVRVDAAIVGGGPAGSIAARRLAQLGWRVMLVERGPENRHKTCGHCLGVKALALLQREGLLQRVRAVATGETRTLRIRGRNGSKITAPLFADDRCLGLLTPRDRLDQTLRDAAAEAGAMVVGSASGHTQQLDGHGARLMVKPQSAPSWQVRCQLLIGADGVGSGVARAAGLADAHSAGRKYGFALDIHADHVATAEQGVIEMFLAPGGYLGVVRQDDGRLHLAALATNNPGVSAGVRTFLKHIARVHPPLAELGLDRIANAADLSLRGAGPMPWRPRDIATSSVALIGDAAGYIEPFTGEGMTWAMESGMLLADAIATGRAWNPQAADIYRRLWRRSLGSQHRRCRLLAMALERPLLSHWMVRAGSATPALARRVIRQVVLT